MESDQEDYPPDEAERRAGELARRLLTTPPKPQSEIKAKATAKRSASTARQGPAKSARKRACSK
jgi:hypothetical protein